MVRFDLVCAAASGAPVADSFESLLSCLLVCARRAGFALPGPELGVTRASAEAVMRQLPKVEVPGLRKVFVKRSDVALFIDRCTKRA